MAEAQRRILALETSGRMGSVALGEAESDGMDHVRLVASAGLSGKMKHAAELIPTIQDVCRQSGWDPTLITDVYVSIGPGSFTGLRIGVSVARTLAWSVGARIVAVPTVDALARNALQVDTVPEHLAVVLDAKRGQVYAAAFDIRAGEVHKIIDAHLSDPTSFLARCPSPLAVLGEGIPYHRKTIETVQARILPKDLWPGRAEHVLIAGQALAAQERFIAGGDLMPLYIRRPEAEEKWEKLHGQSPS